MKKTTLIILVIITFFTLGCNRENNYLCCSPPPDFHLFVNKSSSLYQDFLDDKGEFDKQNVYFYQLLNNNEERKYDTFSVIHTPKKEGYAVVYINSAPFLYTGKTETLYLKNKAKTYKIEFLGTIGECCSAHFQEMYIDGIKNNNFILVK